MSSASRSIAGSNSHSTRWRRPRRLSRLRVRLRYQARLSPSTAVDVVTGRDCRSTSRPFRHRPLDILRRAEEGPGVEHSLEDPGQILGIEGWHFRQLLRHVLDNGLRIPSYQPAALARRCVRNNSAGGPVQGPAIGLDGAVDQALVEAVDGFDDREFRVGRVDAEDDPRHLAVDEFLDHNRHRAGVDIDPELAAVEQSSVAPQRRPHAANGFDHGRAAPHTHKALVEPRERSSWRVLPGSR